LTIRSPRFLRAEVVVLSLEEGARPFVLYKYG